MDPIIVIADAAGEQPKAIAQASQLASLYQAPLKIFGFCYDNLRDLDDQPDKARQAREAIMKAHRQALLDACQQHLQGLDWQLEVIWEKHLHRYINHYVHEHPVALVAKTGHRRQGPTLYTPTDWYLLRECQAPVLIMAEQHWRHGQDVLACIDLGSQREDKQALNLKLLNQGRQLADALGGQLHACYVEPVSPVLRDLGLVDSRQALHKAKQRYQPLMDELARSFGMEKDHWHIKAGQPQRVIPSLAAELKVATVVIGTIGRIGLTGSLLGNTAEQVLNLLKTDVLALKPGH